MATLTKTARTILKSRLRRHNDALLIAQHISGHYGAGNISDLTTSQLVETAQQFGMLIPAQLECDAFDRIKAGNGGADMAFDEADRTFMAEHPVTPPTWAMIGASRPAVNVAALGPDTDTGDEEDMGADETVVTFADGATQTGTPAATPAATLNVSTEVDPTVIDAEVKAVMAAMGAGDFAGYQAKLSDLARRAHKPAVRIEVPAVDTSKLKGFVATVIGHKDMRQAGLPASLAGVATKSTTLPVYNAPDAPRVDPDYRWHDDTGIMLSVWRRGQPVFGFGPAGTGKTEFAKQVAARWGRPFVRISCDDQTEAQTLVGMTVPDKDGGVRWQDGQLTAAIRRPGTVILIDEPSVARPGALFVLQAVMDGDKRLHISETGEVVPVAPDVLLMLADNTNGTGDVTGQYEATRRLNRATLDRPDVFIQFDYMTPMDEAQVIHAKTGLSKKAAAVLARFGALTRSKANDGKLSHGVGLRRLLSLASLLNDGCDPNKAFQTAVIEGAPYDDKEPLRQFWTADVKVDELRAAAQPKAA